MVSSSQRFRFMARFGCMAALTACAPDDKPITQLILVADTDIAGIDTIQFRVSAPDRADTPIATSAHEAGGEPAYVSLVRGDGSLGPVTVSAMGLRQGEMRLMRTQQVSFVQDETRVVALHLAASCVSSPRPRCDAPSQTCTETGCREQALREEDLTSWQGSPPRLAGAPSDGGAPADSGTTPRPDAGGDDASIPPGFMSCGGSLFDTQNDVSHCGNCETACTTPIPPNAHAVNICKGGSCSFECTSGWANCDGKDDTGCEAELNRPERCGSCTNRCEKMQQCMSGVCVMP